MTAHGNLQDAITAIKEGAYDYIEKPVQPERLIKIVQRSIEAREMVSRIAISNPIFDDDVESEFVGTSQKMREVFDLIYRLCKVDTTVLIRGENGTGKELVARAIHFNSPRKTGSFVAINCGAIPENLMESELFGHEKGSFTGAHERKIGKFQLANNGTIFLDEVAELKPDMQVKLLRVLQDRKFVPVGSNREVKTDARIIAATNRNLEKMIEDGFFREDLFYRLNVMPIFLPPLRDRSDDIAELIQYSIKRFSKQHGRTLSGINDDALKAMQNYRWPGNIRELENVIERAFIVENSERISLSSLPDVVRHTKENLDLSLNKAYSGSYNHGCLKGTCWPRDDRRGGIVNQPAALALDSAKDDSPASKQ
jgi:DNA-binding NtrC family response regulator